MTGGLTSDSPPPPWIELPRDVMENILRRLCLGDILEARKVCATWRSVCSEPSLWRVIDFKYSIVNDVMSRRAIDLSQGELIDVTFVFSGTDDLLRYISQRSRHLKRLRIEYCNGITGEGLNSSVKSFPELEELHLNFLLHITPEHIENISISCPKLKSFTLHYYDYRLSPLDIDDTIALKIANNMPNLQHLCLIGNCLGKEGLKAILNGCPNLESLILRRCFNLDIRRDFCVICLKRITYMKYSSDHYVFNDHKLDVQADFGKICLKRIEYFKFSSKCSDDYDWEDMSSDLDYMIYDHED